MKPPFYIANIFIIEKRRTLFILIRPGRALLLLYFFLLAASYADGQLISEDSIQHLIGRSSTDTDRLCAYHVIGDHFNTQNYDSSEKYYRLEIDMAAKLNEPLLQALAMNELCYILFQKKEGLAALKLNLQAQHIADSEKTPNIRLPGKYLVTLGLLPAVLSIPDGARYYVLQHIHLEMGHIYNYGFGQYDKALEQYLLSKQEAERIHNLDDLYGILGNIGVVYQSLGNQERALYFFKEAYTASMRGSEHKWVSGILNSIGFIELKRNHLDSAKGWFLKAMQWAKRYDNLPYEINAADGLADCYLQENNTSSALFYVRWALSLAQSIPFKQGIYLQYDRLSKIFKTKNQFDSAYIYLDSAVQLKQQLTSSENTQTLQNLLATERQRRTEAEAAKIAYQSRERVYILIGGLFVFVVILIALLKNNRNRRAANRQLEKQNQSLEATLEQLKSTQAQLVQSEKMASLGILTAGIAHEIKNPLNFINNFAEVSLELAEEQDDELQKGNSLEGMSIGNLLKDNLKKILFHGKRADTIVKDMLGHSRNSSGIKEPTDINILAKEYLNLAYHGMRAKEKNFTTVLKTDFDQNIGVIKLIPQEVGRVLLNLYNNAFYAVYEKKQALHDSYEPTVNVCTKREGNKVSLSVQDNGNGIPLAVIDKVFQPFFTTKPVGQGTGLGLSLSYDIIKAHGGQIKVQTKEGHGTTFTVELPII